MESAILTHIRDFLMEMGKLEYAIMYREAGSHPIPDEEFEADIKEIIDLLKQVK